MFKFERTKYKLALSVGRAQAHRQTSPLGTFLLEQQGTVFTYALQAQHAQHAVYTQEQEEEPTATDSPESARLPSERFYTYRYSL